MSKLSVLKVEVIESNLYEKWSEDSKIIVYDLIVRAVVSDADGCVYDHKHIFKGYFEDEDGFCHPNFSAKEDAHNLANRVAEEGVIDTKHWNYMGRVLEVYKTQEERLEEAWSDCSDHYERI